MGLHLESVNVNPPTTITITSVIPVIWTHMGDKHRRNYLLPKVNAQRRETNGSYRNNCCGHRVQILRFWILNVLSVVLHSVIETEKFTALNMHCRHSLPPSPISHIRLNIFFVKINKWTICFSTMRNKKKNSIPPDITLEISEISLSLKWCYFGIKWYNLQDIEIELYHLKVLKLNDITFKILKLNDITYRI